MCSRCQTLGSGASGFIRMIWPAVQVDRREIIKPEFETFHGRLSFSAKNRVSGKDILDSSRSAIPHCLNQTRRVIQVETPQVSTANLIRERITD